ncbi:MAG: flagellar filament capping protein FliD [Geminicoccaceae bacterium]
MASTSAAGLGTLTTTGGATRLSGSASGVDTEALIGALSDTRRLPAVRLENRITVNEARASAYGELRGLLATLRDSVAGLRNPPGFLGSRSNLFEAKEAYYSSSTTTSPASLMAVAADSSAATGRYEIVVQRLATAQKLAADPVADAAAALADSTNGGTAFSGSLTLGLAGGARATIAVDGTMSLDDLRAAVNLQSGTSGVTASILQVSATDRRLILTATETGKAVTMANAAGDDVLGILGLSADGGTTVANPIQSAQTALLGIDGVAIERTSNRVTDAVAGLTVDLYRAEPGTTVTVEIGRALGGVKEQLGKVVDAVNALRDFVARQNTVDEDGKVADDAVLFGDTTLRGIADRIGRILSGRVDGLAPGAAASVGALGIRYDGQGRLGLDETVLDGKLLGALDEVRGVLEFRFAASSPDLQLFARGPALGDTAFTVAITDADADGVPESASIDGVAVDIDGTTLVGRDGTAYAGLELIWSGRGSTSIGATATRGIAEQLHAALEPVLDESDGSLAVAADSLVTQNRALAAEVERIDARVADFRARLVQRFAAMETAMSMAQALLQQVRTTTDAMFADN